MKSFVTTCFLLLITLTHSWSQVSNTVSVKLSDAIISRYQPTINNMTSKGWEYSNTIVLHGIEKVYNRLPAASYTSYLNYITNYIALYINTDGTFKAGVSLISLDKIHPGITCLFLYEKTGLARYQVAATAIKNALVGASASYNPYKTPIKNIFWHKQSSYDNIMMLDGMYMAHPFLAKYGRIFGDNAAIDTAVNQTLFAYNQLYTSSNKLIKHAWKEPGSTGSVAWDDAAGNSTSVWSRAMGWYMMALVDILKEIPVGHAKRAQLITALTNLADGIKNHQDPTTGLWYHVVNQTAATLPGNYLETSGSAMFVYALKMACDNGWISSATYLPVAQAGWTGVQTKIDNYTDGKPRVNDFSPAMSVQSTEALYVQASLQPVDCPVSSGTQHPHGYAAVLMAASVMEPALSTLPVHFISFTAKDYTNKIHLDWEIGFEEQLDRYEVQRSTNGADFITIGSVSPAGALKYSWDDLTSGNNKLYYRIKAVSLDGSVDYTSTLLIQRKNAGMQIQVSPNPVTDGKLNLFLTALPAGKYNLKLISNTGAILQSKAILIDNQTGTVISLALTGSISKGLCYVQLDGNDTYISDAVLIK